MDNQLTGDKSSPISSKEDFQVQAPVINLPKGGGAIRGIGEKFAANPVTGTGSMSVPIATSPGRSGFGPQLSLSYDSGAGNGPFGFGWNLSLPSITRKTDKGLPQYLDEVESDIFILSGSEDLVPEFEKDGHGNWVMAGGDPVVYEKTREIDGVAYTVRRYRPRIEGLFARIERWTRRSDGDVHWRSISRDNILSLYGKDTNSRIADPANPNHIFSWLICETRDGKGNAVLYDYKPEDGVGVDLTRAHQRNRGNGDDPLRTANRYLKNIHYGNRTPLLDTGGNRPVFLTETQVRNAGWMFEAVFDYGEHNADAPAPDDAGRWTYRADAFSSYRSGFEVRTTRLCQRVLMFHHFPDDDGVGDNCLVRSTDFTYSHEQDPHSARNPIYTFLLAVTQTGYRRQGDGYLKRSLPPVEFEYTQPEVQDAVEEIDASSLENLPAGVDGAAYQWTDLHGEGIPGILTEQADAWFYKRNLSPISDGQVEFAPLERVATKPNFALGGGAQFMDLAGDGQPDLVVFDSPMPGLYEHDTEEGWNAFQPFTSRLNRNTRDPNLKFVDLDGDGHADVLLTEDNAFVWHASLAEAGFGPARRVRQALDEEIGPRLVFADGTQSIYLADFSGDGLTDLVRIRNGEVCYWPNLGYGNFGAKVTMDHAPDFDHPDQFNHRRIRLADIDGTGTTDIIYLHRDGVRLYFNQSGNGWSEPQILRVFPRVDDLVSIVPADLLGNGTACLVWSSPILNDKSLPLRYVNLMGGQKPHLLVRNVNNLGAETRVRYAPSTKFYLQDKRDGKPWITRLPFPVHVVEYVETCDHISRNRFVTRYAYHHGYFDGEQREFRGFGMVEQWDTEEYATIEGNEDFLASTNFAESSHMPPVHTKTWFHTGIFMGRNHVSDFFAGLLDRHDRGEYYREPAWRDDDEEAARRLLQDTILPVGLAVDEEREACRALKGRMLRQEVYADDGSDKTQHPYTVTEQNFTIRLLQPRQGNRHGVFFTHAREAISYHYERNPEDPRTAHVLTLEVDEFGNVLKSVAVGYGRRPGLSALADEDREKQEQKLITYTENVFTRSITDPVAYPDDFRTPLPCESRTCELTGFDLPEDELRFSFEFFTADNFAALLGASEIAYEETPDRTSGQKRLIEQVRTLYRANDLSGPLDLCGLDTLALPYESYKLAFTPGLLAQVFQRPLDIIRPPGAPPPEDLLPDPAEVLPVDPSSGRVADRGGYIDLDGDGHWWIPSGRVFYSPHADDSADRELTEAQDHFFLPRRFRDPFGQSAKVTYDNNDLLVVRTTDPLENAVTAENDYRVLQPRLLTDPNGNRSEAAFDVLGMVAGTAVMGKRDETVGDSLAGFESELTPEQVETFFDAADPHDPAPMLLASATTRIIYDLDRFRSSRQTHPDDPTLWVPSFAATLARETHVSDPLLPDGLKIQISFSYSDGFGREIQKKIQAEPGPVEGLGDHVAPRWVGSGWTIFNNKGKPVKKYEPFFSTLPQRRHHFEFGVQVGVSAVLFYDPVGRVVATLHPNHTFEKVVFDPWQQITYDVNDTCAPRNDQTGDPRTAPGIHGYVEKYFETKPDWQTWHALRISGGRGPQEQTSANRATVHADTPTIAHFDALGRPFLTVAHNRFMRDGALVEEHYPTRVVLDIEGNQREVMDAKLDPVTQRGRIVMRCHYDMLGNRIHQASMEAGERWMLNDVAGKPIRSWDSRGHHFRFEYDALRRPTQRFVTGTDVERSDPRTSGDGILYEKLVYGEDYPDGRIAAAAQNLLTRVWRQFDGTGMVTSEPYDFKGNVLRSSRRLVREYKAVPNWQTFPEPDDQPDDWEEELFQSSTRYDALNRPIQLVAPHAGSETDVIRPGYNEANLLERIDVWLKYSGEPVALLLPDTSNQHFVTNIEYNAKGQRERIEYGNGARTEYAYDPETFRLVRLLTIRGNKDASECAPVFDPRTCQDPPAVCSRLSANRCILQNFSYTYDPAGNITHISDHAQQIIFFRNRRVEPSSDYTYDAIYRLIEASGREHIGQADLPWTAWNDEGRVGLEHPNDGRVMRVYTEQYEYDEVGNFIRLAHYAERGDWIRTYSCEVPSLIESGRYSNRLSRTTVDGVTETYTHDIHGNMTRMPHLPVMDWDFRGQLRATSQQVVTNGSTPETTYYVYDASGQRVRKVTELQAAAGRTPIRKNERLYLGGFEVYREYNGGDEENLTLERETLQIMDDKQRIAMIETRTAGHDDSLRQLIRYQLGNHLGSASLELDAFGQVISYEEYYPYGTSSYQAMRTEVPKRYRYTGMERDEETGLNYHSARYLSSWLGRWCSADPAGMVDGPNRYRYTRNNPIVAMDPKGKHRERLPNAPPSRVQAGQQGGAPAPAPGSAAQPLVSPREAVQQMYEGTLYHVFHSYIERGGTEEGFQQLQALSQRLYEQWGVSHGGAGNFRDMLLEMAAQTESSGELLETLLNEIVEAVEADETTETETEGGGEDSGGITLTENQRQLLSGLGRSLSGVTRLLEGTQFFQTITSSLEGNPELLAGAGVALLVFGLLPALVQSSREGSLGIMERILDVTSSAVGSHEIDPQGSSRVIIAVGGANLPGQAPSGTTAGLSLRVGERIMQPPSVEEIEYGQCVSESFQSTSCIPAERQESECVGEAQCSPVFRRSSATRLELGLEMGFLLNEGEGGIHGAGYMRFQIRF
jgi:RHS repeat-associated protein